ncbi:uncharacterized protein LOC118645681 [Monomorium pharaonis]|uniref:uncharacterized protein LOC118645681 n=1 Tax=Monomorium pharaonis TaxID=307658 RepID=UPI001746DC62|nr:uncharacterized protein LOC118645681 [Monomorium pharaonis]
MAITLGIRLRGSILKFLLPRDHSFPLRHRATSLEQPKAPAFLPFVSLVSVDLHHCCIIVLESPIENIMEVAKVNDSSNSLVEQSMNVTSATKSVSTTKSVQSVQTKSVVESSTSLKSVTSSSTRKQQSMEYEETVEYSD